MMIVKSLPKALDIDELNKNIKLVLDKVIYNRNKNKAIRPFKDKLKKLNGYTFLHSEDAVTVAYDGTNGQIRLQRVFIPYVNLEKLLANSKDAKKYVTYKTSYRLTAKEFDVVELEEVA